MIKFHSLLKCVLWQFNHVLCIFFLIYPFSHISALLYFTFEFLRLSYGLSSIPHPLLSLFFFLPYSPSPPIPHLHCMTSYGQENRHKPHSFIMSANIEIFTGSGGKLSVGTSEVNRNSCPQGRYILGREKIDK